MVVEKKVSSSASEVERTSCFIIIVVFEGCGFCGVEWGQGSVEMV